MNLQEAIANLDKVDEVSNSLKGRYLKAAIEDLEWFVGIDSYSSLTDKEVKQWNKRKAAVLKLIDQLTAKK